jgi:protein DGCR14
MSSDSGSVGWRAKKTLQSLVQHEDVTKNEELSKTALMELTDRFLEKVSESDKIILEEDEYIEKVSSIIERDFFPYLNQLKAQEDFFHAVDSDDMLKLQELIAKYGRSYLSNTLTPFIVGSPSTFDTPGPINRDEGRSPMRSTGSRSKSQRDSVSDGTEKTVGLNEFMRKTTSEDNMSFKELVQLQAMAQRIKSAWIYTAEEKAKERFAIQQERHKAIEDGLQDPPDPRTLDTWPYVARNMLMFNPEGIDVALQDRVKDAKNRAMKIQHKNTRFQPGFLEQMKVTSRLNEYSTANKAVKRGKVGADGMDVVASEEQNKIGGYSILGTPSPMPGLGADSSPAMLWGSIDNTPVHLSDASGVGIGYTPLISACKTPAFRIADIPLRDKLAMQLAEKAAKNHRAKKARALNEVQSHLLGRSPNFGSVRSSTGHVSKRMATDSMSPTAQKLLANRLKVSALGRALSTSRSPSVSSKSPLVTLTKSGASPARSSIRSCRSPAVNSPRLESLTDDLLELKNTASDKQRSSAADFF